MVNRVSAQGVDKLLNLVAGVTPLTTPTSHSQPAVAAVVLDETSTVEADFDTADDIDAITTDGIYTSGATTYKVAAPCAVTVDGSVVKVAITSFFFTALPADNGAVTPKKPKYVLLYIVQGSSEFGDNATNIPLALFQPDFVGTPPDGTNYTLTFPTTGAIRLETA